MLNCRCTPAVRSGTETELARVIAVLGAAQPHCAYLFANRRATRMKVLVHDGFGIWLAARRLNQGRFHWPGILHGSEMELNRAASGIGAGPAMATCRFWRLDHAALTAAISPSSYRRKLPALAKSAP
ncbi:IS66 Orf2 like protein [compost metagenome]